MTIDMRRPRVVAALGAVLLLTAACGSSAGTAAGGNHPAAVSTSDSAGLGPILVDAHGRTLYFTDSDTAAAARCTGDCLGFWQPLVVAGGTTPTASADLTGMLGRLVRKDAGTQVTYAGHPLYTFTLDRTAGQVVGNGFKDEFGGTSFTWHAVRSDGSAAAAGGSMSSSGGYGHGY
jgi:predicted lipoprotein with Yx(FWY)xxD motif